MFRTFAYTDGADGRLVDANQLRYEVDTLPVLSALLKTLTVQEIINLHCPTRAGVAHGAVMPVLIFSRLMSPLSLHQIADWVAQTMLVTMLEIPCQRQWFKPSIMEKRIFYRKWLESM